MTQFWLQRAQGNLERASLLLIVLVSSSHTYVDYISTESFCTCTQMLHTSGHLNKWLIKKFWVSKGFSMNFDGHMALFSVVCGCAVRNTLEKISKLAGKSVCPVSKLNTVQENRLFCSHAGESPVSNFSLQTPHPAEPSVWRITRK